jgi:hypothetical protein
MAKYGLWEFGEGTGKYSPATSTGTRKENDILAVAVRKAEKVYGDKIFQRKIHGGGYQRSGLPDVYIAIAGTTLWVEFKRPGADTTALQKKTLEDLKRLGIYCGTAESTKTYLEILQTVVETEQRRKWLK